MNQISTRPAAASDIFEVTAPIRIPGESDAQTIFAWMLTNRYLWMLDGEENANRVDEVVGTARLIGLAGKRMRLARQQPDHDALRCPEEESAREFAYKRLARFFELHIDLDT